MIATYEAERIQKDLQQFKLKHHCSIQAYEKLERNNHVMKICP